MTANLFAVLGMYPSPGRSFRREDEMAASPPVVILSYALWRGRLGGNPSVLGNTIKLNGEPHSVIGIMPADFRVVGLPEAEVFLPLKMDNPHMLARSIHALLGYARLRPGVDMKAAGLELAGIERELGREDSVNDGAWTASVLPALSPSTDAKRKLPFFVSATALLLLLGCANSASLALTRYLDRHSEMLLRSALGATRSRIAQQILAESLLIAIVAGMLGFGIGLGGIQWIRADEPVHSMAPIPAIPDWRVMAVCGALVLGTAFLFGIVPALSISRSANMTASPGSSSRMTSSARSRRPLVIVGIALAVSLLTAAGLIARTMHNLYSTDLGFKPEHLIEGELMLQAARYKSPASQRALVNNLLARGKADLQRAITSYFPLSSMDGTGGGYFNIEDRPTPQPIESAPIAGRTFQEHESRPVVVINQELADRFWPHRNPIGKVVTFLRPMESSADLVAPGPREIVGIVGDTREFGARQEKLPYLYIPFDQNPVPWVAVVVRASQPFAALRILKQRLNELDPEIPLSHVHTATDLIEQGFRPVHFQMMILAFFSCTAVLLSFIGTLSAIREQVRQRRKEFAIRMAVGAGPGEIRRILYGSSLALVGYGLLLGFGFSLLLGRSIAGVLFGVSSWDNESFGPQWPSCAWQLELRAIRRHGKLRARTWCLHSVVRELLSNRRHNGAARRRLLRWIVGG